MNRVTFKGVVEKEELLKIVTRLWKQEQKAEEGESWKIDENLGRNFKIINLFVTQMFQNSIFSFFVNRQRYHSRRRTL